jgi:hypothetical protein
MVIIIPYLFIGCNFRHLSCRCEYSGGYVAVHRWHIKLFCNVRNAANGMICEIHVVNIVFILSLSFDSMNITSSVKKTLVTKIRISNI